MAKDSFILYKQHFKQIELLTMEERGQLLTAILCHVNGESAPPVEIAVKLLLTPIAERIDIDTAKYNEICEKNAENGKKGAEFGKLGGRPKKLASYDEILYSAELPPPVRERVQDLIRYFALNKHNLKNDELIAIIEKIKQKESIQHKISYVQFLETKRVDEILNIIQNGKRGY